MVFQNVVDRGHLGISETGCTFRLLQEAGVHLAKVAAAGAAARSLASDGLPHRSMDYWEDSDDVTLGTAAPLLAGLRAAESRIPRGAPPPRPAGRVKRAAFHPEPEPLTEEEMSKIKLGTSAIYFFGAITYRDAFSRNRKTLFRFQHGGSRVFGTEDMTLSPKGNRAT